MIGRTLTNLRPTNVVLFSLCAIVASVSISLAQDSPESAAKRADELFAEGRRIESGIVSGERTDSEISSDRSLAIDKFSSAKDLFRQLGDRKNEGYCLIHIGNLYSKLHDYQKAVATHEQAISLFRDIKDRDEEAIALGHLATVHREGLNYSKAIQTYIEAAEIGRQAGNKFTEGQAEIELGRTYLQSGEFRKALDNFRKGLSLFRETAEKSHEGDALILIGGTHDILGEVDAAREWYETALEFHRKNKFKYGEARCDLLLASLYRTLGENQIAIAHFDAAIAIYTGLNDTPGLADARRELGEFYAKLGQREKALGMISDALASYRKIQRKNGVSLTLQSLARMLGADAKRKDEALRLMQEALDLSRQAGDKSIEADVLLDIGILYESSFGDHERALKYKRESLDVYDSIGAMPGIATALHQIGTSYWASNQYSSAFVYFSFAYAISRRSGDLQSQAALLQWLQNATLERPNLAILYGKLAVNTLQLRRSKAMRSDKEAQKAYLKTFELLYRRLAEELLRQDRLAEALQVLQAFKDQQFYDSQPDGDVANLMLELTPEENAFIRDGDEASDAFAEAYVALTSFRRSFADRPITADEAKREGALKNELKAAEGKFTDFAGAAWNRLPANINPIQTRDSIGLQRILKTLGEQTGSGAPVIAYQYVGNVAYYTLLITPTGIKKFSAPSDFYATNALAQKYWALLQSDKYDPRTAGKDLYDVVFRPLEKDVPSDTKTIIWSLDGNLRYVPMAALFDGQRYLVERYDNVVFTRAEGDRLTRAVSSKWTAEAFGSSKAHSVDITGNRVSFGALPGVGAELDALFGNRSKHGVLIGDVVRDEFFTRKRMLEKLELKRPVVHIASHFSFKPGDDGRSFLVLGDGTAFTLADMKQQKDMFAGVELLTLSACNTAAQQPDANGREVDAFFELAQRLGAQSVMATLWPVADNSTPWLMREFYDLKVNKKQNKAEALRNAQLALLNGSAKTAKSRSRTDASQIKIVVESESQTAVRAETRAETRAERFTISKTDAKPFVADPKRPFAHPFYWSPFVLIGNWR